MPPIFLLGSYFFRDIFFWFIPWYCCRLDYSFFHVGMLLHIFSFIPSICLDTTYISMYRIEKWDSNLRRNKLECESVSYLGTTITGLASDGIYHYIYSLFSYTTRVFSFAKLLRFVDNSQEYIKRDCLKSQVCKHVNALLNVTSGCMKAVDKCRAYIPPPQVRGRPGGSCCNMLSTYTCPEGFMIFCPFWGCYSSCLFLYIFHSPLLGCPN